MCRPQRAQRTTSPAATIFGREARRCLSCGAGAEWIAGKCAYCLNCVKVCPYGVLIIADHGHIDIRVDQCQACGICYSACPRDAIAFNMLGVSELQSRIESALHQVLSSHNGSTTLALYCDFDVYDLSNFKKVMEKNHKGTAFVTVPCLAKIKTIDLLRAFEFGANAVLVIGCPAEECAYQQGAIWAERTVTEAKKLLADIGLDDSRLELHYASGLKSGEFEKVLAEFTERVNNPPAAAGDN